MAAPLGHVALELEVDKLGDALALHRAQEERRGEEERQSFGGKKR